MKKITFLKSGNRMVLEPSTPEVKSIAVPLLTFTEKEFLHGPELTLAKRTNQPTVRFKEWACYSYDYQGRIATPFGFFWRLGKAFKQYGYAVALADCSPAKPEVFSPYWDNLEIQGLKLRHRQRELLETMVASRCGRIDCAPGFGKTFSIGCLALVLPKARIDVVTKSKTVAAERIYPELAGMLPSVGLVTSGVKRTGRRVMVYTAGSYHHTPGDAHILIGDECHELASDSFAGKLGFSSESRNFGLSATHDKRFDGKDFRLEGIFGPVIFRIGYQEAQDNKLVVPIQVRWRSVFSDFDPSEGAIGALKNKRGIWTNDFRNDLIAADARSYDDDTQVLIVCATIEHAVHLKRRLPEFKLVYAENGMSARDRHVYIKQGYLPKNEPLMTAERRRMLTQLFEKGKIKKAIVTTVWNVGVSFNNLSVLIRADAGGSAIGNTQIPGRVSRTADGKSFGVVHDYLDQFSYGFRRKAMTRSASYKENGWQQIFPDKPKPGSLLAQLDLDWEDA